MGLFCLGRQTLNSIGNNIYAGLISYWIIMVVTVVTSELAWSLEETLLSSTMDLNLDYYLFLLKNLAISAVIAILVLGFFYQHHLLEKSTFIISYLLILLAVLILSQLTSFFLTIPSSHYLAGRHELFLLRNIGMSAIISAITLRYFYIQHYWKEETIANANAQLQALQARIHPHFLFNSMNIIASLIRFHPEKAEQAVEDLAELFRASLTEVKGCITFQEELALCQHYLRIETLRLEERLQVIWQIDKIPLDARIPALSLQPLLENAIYHGIQLLAEGGIVYVTGLFDGRTIRIEVENPIPTIKKNLFQSHHIAHRNIEQRLKIYYGEGAKLGIQCHDHLYCASLCFPYQL
jgi:two-component system sensor histidine kinase AlgZ